MKKILAFSASVCLTLSAAGCGDEKSSSDTISVTTSASAETTTVEAASTETTVAETASTTEKSLSSTDKSSESQTEYKEIDITETVKNEGGLDYHMSKCGNFTFGISDELDIYEVDDFDIAFTNGDDSIIGMYCFCGFHNTVKSLAKDMIADYEEKYTNVAYGESTVNGVPCFNITADSTAADANATELKIRFSALQYGNGDIIHLAYMGAAEAQPQLEEYYQQMLDSIEYLGEPLKTEDETFSNEYYAVTASPMWYIKDKMGSVKIGLNLQDSIDEIYYGITLSGPSDEKSAKDAAESLNNTKKGLDSTVSSEIDETEICGYDAFRVTTHTKIGDIDFFLEFFYFDKDGKSRSISFMYPNGREEEFKENIQPILESLEIK